MRVLTVNTGSSSVKVAIYEVATPEPQLVAAASAERVGAASQPAALRDVISRLTNFGPVSAVVHRVVHGGPQHMTPQIVTDSLLGDLRALVALAPEHLPPSIQAIEFTGNTFDVPQIACFDTAFHQHLPVVAQMFPLPRRFWESGIRRYGFHGLSCESVMQALGRLDPSVAAGRVVVAHLGSGASLTAVRGGKSVDTTMGLSPVGGLMMGTRSGDLDPSVVLHALAAFGDDRKHVVNLVTRQSGLLGVSGRSADMRDLLAVEATDADAAEAVNLFCYLAKKALGSFMAALGGLDALVFTGGIGENAPTVRARMCEGLEGLGLTIDRSTNDANAPLISSASSRVAVRIVPSDEDGMLAFHAQATLKNQGWNVRL